MSDIKRNQHFVPQFYLRRFTQTANIIWVFDKVRRRSWKKSIPNVASEDWFYETGSVPPASNHDQVVENSLSEEEGLFNTTVGNVLEDAERKGSVDFKKVDTRVILTRFVALQFVRTRQFRDMITNCMTTLAATLNEKQRFAYEKAKATGMEVEEPKPFVPEPLSATDQADYMYGEEFMNRLMRIFISHVWTLQKATGGEKFLASDDPVASFWHGPSTIFGSGGLTARGIEMAIPLSSTYLLSMREPTHFANLIPMEGAVFTTSEPLLHFYNSLQVISSKQHLFAEDERFSCVQHVLDQHPEYMNPDRPRFTLL
jgi:hypothetical protein